MIEKFGILFFVFIFRYQVFRVIIKIGSVLNKVFVQKFGIRIDGVFIGIVYD